MSFFRYFGAIMSTILSIGLGYEALALWTKDRWPPTYSNLVQGLRDSGHHVLVFFIAMAAVCCLAMFGAWLYYHFVFEPRTLN